MPKNKVPPSERPEFRRRLLQNLCNGRRLAIQGVLLAYDCGFDADGSDRLTRMMIRELIAEGIPIASSTGKPAGFFIAETVEEVQKYAAVLKRRLIEDALRRRDFLRAARKILQPTQLKLEV